MTPHQYAQTHEARFVEELIELVKIPSVSTQPEHREDVERAARWLIDQMDKIGIENGEIVLMPGGRCPLVYGDWLHAGPDRPTILYYAHYDVQPALKSDGWHTEPFEPVIKDGQLFARGATDSKIHVLILLKALESLFANHDGKLPVNIKIIFEGEEESGSENLNAFTQQHGDRLKADIAVISDGPIISPDQPSIVGGLRGIVSFEINVKGPARDLHSGHYGGSVHNPIQALCELVAQLHASDGRVEVPGFYDQVRIFSDEERAAMSLIDPIWQGEWDRVAAAPNPWGEPDYSLHERTGIRPTLELNGIWGGYTQTGVKTVLPAEATAKITCRLVPYQNPTEILDLVEAQVKALSPPTVTVTMTRQDMGAEAVLIDYQSKPMRLAKAAYEEHWKRETALEMAGGSIPITAAFRPLVGEVVLMGFAHKGGQAHGPNENIFLSNYSRGIATVITFLTGL
ncbi:MAG: dipeptidase [Chloroflexota bacterium]